MLAIYVHFQIQKWNQIMQVLFNICMLKRNQLCLPLRAVNQFGIFLSPLFIINHFKYKSILIYFSSSYPVTSFSTIIFELSFLERNDSSSQGWITIEILPVVMSPGEALFPTSIKYYITTLVNQLEGSLIVFKWTWIPNLPLIFTSYITLDSMPALSEAQFPHL